MRTLFRNRCLSLLVLVVLILSLTVTQYGEVFGQMANTGRANWYHKCSDSGMLSVTTGAAVGFDVTKITITHPESSEVWFRVEDNDIRFWNDGSTPTSTEGNLAQVGEVVRVPGYENIQNFLAIAINGTANLSCNYATEKKMK